MLSAVKHVASALINQLVEFAKKNAYEPWALSMPRLKRVDTTKLMDFILQDEYGTSDLLMVPSQKDPTLGRFV